MRWPQLPIPQRDREEWLDARSFARPEVARSLRDVARINAFLGATNALHERVWTMIEDAQLPRATVLDIGCGNGDFARRLVHQSRTRNIELQVLALDLSPLHLGIAREMTPPQGKNSTAHSIHFLGADAFVLPLRDQSVDIVTSTLFLHHFRPAPIESLLREASRVARLGWAMNDCARDGVAVFAFRVLRPVLARSFITRYDALASIRRAYTAQELQAITVPLEGVVVRDLFPYRLQLEWTRSTSSSSAQV